MQDLSWKELVDVAALLLGGPLLGRLLALPAHLRLLLLLLVGFDRLLLLLLLVIVVVVVVDGGDDADGALALAE